LKEPGKNGSSFSNAFEVNHVYSNHSDQGPNKLYRREGLTKIEKPEIPKQNVSHTQRSSKRNENLKNERENTSTKKARRTSRYYERMSLNFQNFKCREGYFFFSLMTFLVEI